MNKQAQEVTKKTEEQNVSRKRIQEEEEEGRPLKKENTSNIQQELDELKKSEEEMHQEMEQDQQHSGFDSESFGNLILEKVEKHREKVAC